MIEIAKSVAATQSTQSFDILQHTRSVRDQSQLDAQARTHNIAGAFCVSLKSSKTATLGNTQPLIIVDDLITTGATLSEAIGPSEIRRVDQRRAVVLSANLVGFDMGGAIHDVTRTLRHAPFDADQTWEMGGQARELSSSGNSLLLALALAIFLVYVVMASTFENLLHPLVILLTVPLALFGVAGGLAATGLPLSVPAFMGVIVLAGVVVNNAIVLVDATNRLRDDGEARLSSVHRAAALRLRPILITAITTVLGLLPLAFGFGAGIEVQRPLAVTVVGGMATATLLTLVVIPAVYVLVTGGTKPDAAKPGEVTP